MRLICLLALTGLLFASPAQAILTNASVTPPTTTANVATAVPAALNWTVARAGAPGSVTVVSPQVDFALNGVVVASVAKTLSKTMNAVNNVDFFMFSEVVTIPRSVLAQAAQTGQAVTVRRSFQEVNVAGTQTASANVALTGGLGGDLNITQIDLVFNDGTTSCSTQSGEERTAIARIRSNGNGLLRGSWQVREGGGLGSYRVLRVIQTPVGGNSYTELRSPRLPLSDGMQRVDVRLVITSPALAFFPPEISCGISNSAAVPGAASNEKQATVIAPSNPVTLQADTVITWEKYPGAKTYRIDVLPRAGGKPVASQSAKGDATSARLSPLTLQKLNRKSHYVIRVVAE